MSRRRRKDVSKAVLVFFVIGLFLILVSLISAVLVKNYIVAVVFSILGVFVLYTFFVMYRDYMSISKKKKK